MNLHKGKVPLGCHGQHRNVTEVGALTNTRRRGLAHAVCADPTVTIHLLKQPDFLSLFLVFDITSAIKIQTCVVNWRAIQ